MLLDAPCTATGAIRRHPDVPHLKQPEDVARLSVVQDNLLRAAVEILRPGGMLVYCTCSLEPEEGPVRVEALLRSGAAVARKPIAPDEVGAADWLTESGDMRTLPCHLPEHDGIDGFYAARLVKLGEARGAAGAAIGGRHGAMCDGAGRMLGLLAGGRFPCYQARWFRRRTARPHLPRVAGPADCARSVRAPMKPGPVSAAGRGRRAPSRGSRRDAAGAVRALAGRRLAGAGGDAVLSPDPDRTGAGELRLKLNERWPGDPRRGNAILAGNIEFAGELIRRPTPAWFPPGAAPSGWRSGTGSAGSTI